MTQNPPVDEPDELLDDVPEDDFEDFDAFWSERERKRRPIVTRICGVEVEAPGDVPLNVEVRVQQLSGSTREEDYRELIGDLLGEGTLDELITAGVSGPQLRVLFVWAMVNGQGKRITLAEAADLAEQAEAEQGKAPRRERRAAQRRTRSGGRSAGTGR